MTYRTMHNTCSVTQAECPSDQVGSFTHKSLSIARETRQLLWPDTAGAPVWRTRRYAWAYLKTGERDRPDHADRSRLERSFRPGSSEGLLPTRQRQERGKRRCSCDRPEDRKSDLAPSYQRRTLPMGTPQGSESKLLWLTLQDFVEVFWVPACALSP